MWKRWQDNTNRSKCRTTFSPRWPMRFGGHWLWREEENPTYEMGHVGTSRGRPDWLRLAHPSFYRPGGRVCVYSDGRNDLAGRYHRVRHPRRAPVASKKPLHFLHDVARIRSARSGLAADRANY